MSKTISEQNAIVTADLSPNDRRVIKDFLNWKEGIRYRTPEFWAEVNTRMAAMSFAAARAIRTMTFSDLHQLAA